MTEIAALGLRADSSSLVVATEDLKKLSKAAGEAEQAAEKLAPAEKKAGAAAGEMGDKARRAATDTKKLGDDSRTTEGALHRLAERAGTVAGTLVAMATAAFSVGAYVRLADSWSDMQSVVGAATKDMDGAGQTMRRLADLAAASYSPLEQTARGFAANATILKELGYNTQQMLDYTEALNHALVINAAKGENAAVVQNALGRALATGKLQATEYEVIMSRSPRVLEAIAKEMGTTVASLRQLGSEGKITGEIIGRALTGELVNLREEAGNMPATVGDAFTLIGNSFLELVGVFDQTGQISAGLADRLVDLSKWIRSLADIDFAGWMGTAASAGTVLAQVILVLATMRIAALVSGFSLVAARSAIATAAMTVQAGAARALGAAMAFAGGPIGIAVGAMAAVELAMYSSRSEAMPLSGALTAVATAQRDLNSAMREYENTGTGDALQAARAAADETVAKLQEALKAAEAEMANARANVDFAGAGDMGMGALFSEERLAGLNAMIEKVAQIRKELADAVGVQGQLNEKWEAAAQSLGVAASELTAEQLKAFEQSEAMLRSYGERARLAQIEAQHGKDSAQYMSEQLSQERAIQHAKINSLDISNQQKAALRDQYDEMMRLEAKTQGWAVSIGKVNGPLSSAYDWLVRIRDTQPGDSWLSTAISRATDLAAKLLEAVGYTNILAEKASPQNTGSTDWYKDGNGLALSHLYMPSGVKGAAGGAGGGGGGGGSDQFAGNLQSLIESLETEQATVDAWYESSKAILFDRRAEEILGEQAHLDAKLALEQEYQRRLSEIRDAERNARFTEAADMFSGLASIAAAGGSKMLKSQAVLSAAATMIAGYEAAMKAAAEATTIPGRIAAYAKFVGMGLSAAAQIRKAGGVGGGGGTSSRGGSSAASTVSQAQSGPVAVSIQGLDPDTLYTGRQVINLTDAVQKEFKRRGVVLTFTS